MALLTPGMTATRGNQPRYKRRENTLLLRVFRLGCVATSSPEGKGPSNRPVQQEIICSPFAKLLAGQPVTGSQKCQLHLFAHGHDSQARKILAWSPGGQTHRSVPRLQRLAQVLISSLFVGREGHTGEFSPSDRRIKPAGFPLAPAEGFCYCRRCFIFCSR